jgi:hypothetical protein
VPLNEGQRKVLAALRRDQCRFLAIEGPPGCGKSHTIVAIVFEAILTGKNVLVLSDKKEALDVVEEKLTKVLNEVRIGTDFQNPILRLGKAGNTYGKILNSQALSAITAHHRVAAAGAGQLRTQIKAEETKLKSEINELAARGQAIDVGNVAALARRESDFDFVRGLDAILSDDARLTALEDARAIAKWLTGAGEAAMRLMRATAPKSSLSDLANILELQGVLAGIPGVRGEDLTAVSFFTGFAPDHHAVLENFVRQYYAAKQPVVGYLFTRARARAIDQEVGRQLPCRSALEAHRKVGTLVRAVTVLSSLRASFGKAGIAVEHHHWAYQQMIDNVAPMTEQAPEMLKRVLRLQDMLARDTELAGLGIEADDLGWVDTAVVEGSVLARLTEFAEEYRRMKTCFSELPEFDYVGEKSRLESLHTQRLVHTIDERVVEFANEHKNLARSLRDIIRKRQRFPQEAFEHLKQAFPCMIAGIRDYAEYVPLEQGLFDLVIIDEARQGSF